MANCTACKTSGAYIGFSTIECRNPKCCHFAPSLKEEEFKVGDKVRLLKFEKFGNWQCPAGAVGFVSKIANIWALKNGSGWAVSIAQEDWNRAGVSDWPFNAIEHYKE